MAATKTKPKYYCYLKSHNSCLGSFDRALYEKVVQLLDSRPDLKRAIVPRLCKLHNIMAAMWALSTSVENSDIDDTWMEADTYIRF